MSRQGLVFAVVTLMVSVTATACMSEVGGRAAPVVTTDATARSTTTTTTAPGAQPPRGPDRGPRTDIAAPGECISGDDPAPVDCAQPHTLEVTTAGVFGGALGDAPPDRDVVFETVFPFCRSAAAGYLGSDDYDTTTLAAWLRWADEDAWKRGERWYRCGVVQLDSEGKALERKGSIRGALSGNGIHEYRLCSLTPPSRGMPRPTPCDQPHRGEAVSVVSMGTPQDPLPTKKEFNAAAERECADAVHDHLGADRDDVHTRWLWPDKNSWRRGYTNLTCYLETDKPVTASLRGIGSKPLPRR